MARPKQLGDGEVVTLTIRLPRDLRDAFAAKLLDDDQQASQVLRRAIRQYLAGNAPVASTAAVTAPRPAQISSPAPEPMRAPEPSALMPEAVTQAPRAVRGGELFEMIWAVNAEAQAELGAQAQRPENAEEHD